MCSFAPFSNSNKVSWCWWSCPRWSKVSPDHILNESVLRSEDPLSTAVLLALSKTKPKGSQREKGGGRGRGKKGEREKPKRLAEGGRDVSRTLLCHAMPHQATPRHTTLYRRYTPRHAAPRHSWSGFLCVVTISRVYL